MIAKWGWWWDDGMMTRRQGQWGQHLKMIAKMGIMWWCWGDDMEMPKFKITHFKWNWTMKKNMRILVSLRIGKNILQKINKNCCQVFIVKALKKKLRQDKSGFRNIEYIKKKNYLIIYSCLISNHLIKR